MSVLVIGKLSSLIPGTEMVLKMLVYSPFNHLTQLLAQEYVAEFSHHGSFKLYVTKVVCIRGAKIFYNSGSHLKTLGSRMVK
jgi:hypothetical protein